MEQEKRIAVTSFATLTALFFGWGLITSNNGPLLDAQTTIFSLNTNETQFAQIVFFMAYGVISFPAAFLVKKYGSMNTIIIGLGAIFLGCILECCVAYINYYILALAAIFVMASGIAILQVSANPLVAALGTVKLSHFRLVFAQAFNALGALIGARFGAILLFQNNDDSNSEHTLTQISGRLDALMDITKGYLFIAVLILLLMVIVYFSNERIENLVNKQYEKKESNIFSACKSKTAIFGAFAIALYVGAEVAIAAILVDYLMQSNVLNLQSVIANKYVAEIYWGGALIGRFIGALLLRRIKAANLLMFCATINSIACAIVITTHGTLAGYSALAIGLFNSIMFPTIFTITLEKSKAPSYSVSALLCFGIIGGAIMPFFVKKMVHLSTYGSAFLLPLISYFFILIFAYFTEHNQPATE